MNLMKLLTVGQSLKKGPVLGKYKVQQILLPKFGSTVRPSKSALTAEKQVSTGNIAASVPATPICSVEAGSQNVSAPRDMDKTQKIPAGKILRRVEEFVESPRGPGFVAQLRARCLAFLQKQISSLKKKSGLAPVQTEWSLEKVTVIRNDLNDADLEIVAPKTPSNGDTCKPNLPDLNRVKNSGKEWIKKTTRLFKTSSPFEVSAMEKEAETSHAEFAGRS